MAGAVVELNNNSTVKADDRIEISTALPSAFEKNSATFKPEEGSEVILRDSAISGGDVAVVSNKISLLGNSRVTIGNDGRFLAMGAGSSVQMVSGGSKNDKDTFTEAKGNGKIAISKATYDNLLKAGVMPFIKDYVIVSDTVVDKSTVDKKDTVAEYKDIVNNDRLTEAQKVEKIKEVLSGNENAVALATAVQGHVDNATTAAPQTSTAIPAATSVETTNVAAGEGVMSSDESAVKGVDKKKK